MTFSLLVDKCRGGQTARFYSLLLVFCGSIFWGAVSSAQQVQEPDWLRISDVRWRAPIPGQVMAVAYVSLENLSDRPITLNLIDVDWAKKAEFHTHLHEQGMMRMRRLEQLPIQPGEVIEMGSGGLHIMLFGVQEKVTERRALPLTLRGSDGRSATVDLLGKMND